MGKYLAPLGVFVVGNLALLVVFLFLTTIGNAGDQLLTDAGDMADVFWNFSMVASNVKFFVFLIFELVVLYLTGKAFLKVR